MIRKYDGNDLLKVLVYNNLCCESEQTLFNIVCPFHEDINPSMRIDLNSGTYFCFGCEERGNAFDFVRRMFPELNEVQCCVMLEKIIHNKKVVNVKFNKNKTKRNKKNFKRALLEAEDYFYGLRSVDWNRVQTDEEREVLQYMQKRGFTPKQLNVADCRVNCSIAYQIIFPILDNGVFKGWVCRTNKKSVQDKRKYLYNDGFYKRDTLCGNYSENCIPVICEGYMDYLSMRTRGHYKNTVAILGWHMSDMQAEKLKQKGIKTVISALDNDSAGIKGSEYLKRYFNVIRFPYDDGIKDIGEMSEQQLVQKMKQIRKEIKDIDV